MKKILLSVLAMGAMSVSAYAACSGATCANVKVTKLYMTAGGTMYVGTDGTEANLDCGGISGVYMSLAEGNVGKNAMYSLLLTAQTTNKSVTIRTAPDCSIAYITN